MISQSRYVNIVSGVGGASSVAQRKLIMRLVTRNSAIPPGIVAEFSTADSVGSYFGTSSEEYLRARAYFAFISKSINSPSLISFTRWVSSAIPASIVGDTVAKTVSQFQSVSAPALTLVANGVNVPVTAIDFSTATDLVDVAQAVQTAVVKSTNPELSAATITYNSNTNQFVLTGSPATAGAGQTLTALASTSASDIAGLLGWTTTGSTNVPGQTADTAADAIDKSANISDNFGSFAIIQGGDTMANEDYQAVAAWTDEQNNKFMFSIATPMSNIAALYALIKGYSGVAINVLSTSLSNDYIEQSPCEILASTDYTKVNAAQNYMYYQFAARNVTVSTDPDADTADSNRANYIGQTQSAGQTLAFYQRGILCGGSAAAVDMNVFANEMWLKSAVTAQILNLFLAMPEIPASDAGRIMILAVLQSIITTAKNNGTITSGKTLTAVQQQYVSSVTGDANAWRQIQNIGYWLDVQFDSYTNTDTGLTEWEANYTLLYSKGDAIRKVNGTDSMI